MVRIWKLNGNGLLSEGDDFACFEFADTELFGFIEGKIKIIFINHRSFMNVESSERFVHFTEIDDDGHEPTDFKRVTVKSLAEEEFHEWEDSCGSDFTILQRNF